MDDEKKKKVIEKRYTFIKNGVLLVIIINLMICFILTIYNIEQNYKRVQNIQKKIEELKTYEADIDYINNLYAKYGKFIVEEVNNRQYTGHIFSDEGTYFVMYDMNYQPIDNFSENSVESIEDNAHECNCYENCYESSNSDKRIAEGK